MWWGYHACTEWHGTEGMTFFFATGRHTTEVIEQASTPAPGSEQLHFETLYPRTFMQQVSCILCNYV